MTETVDRIASAMQPVSAMTLPAEPEIVDKTVIERLILEHSDRLELEINQKARADAWKFYFRVRVDHVVRPFAVCKVCFRVLHCDSRSGTASLLRHPCNPLSERSPVNRAVKLSAKLNLPTDTLTKGELFKSLTSSDASRKLGLHDVDPLAAFRRSTTPSSSPNSTDSSPSMSQTPVSASITLSAANSTNGGRKRKVGAQSPVFPLDLRLLQLPQMMAAVAAHPLAAINLANATALLSDPQHFHQIQQQQAQLEHLLREQQHLAQERELKRNREDDPFQHDRSRNEPSSSHSPSWPKSKIKKERIDASDEAKDFSATGQFKTNKDHADDKNGILNKEMVQQLITGNSSRVFLTDKDSSGAHYISDVWSRFYVVYVDGIVRPFAACRMCRKVVTYSRYSGTGGLLRHRCSSIQDNRSLETTLHDGLSGPIRGPPLETMPLVEPPRYSGFHQVTPLAGDLSFAKESAKDKTTMMASVAKALLRYMCHDMVSASTFDSPAFQHMVRTVLGLGAAHGTFNGDQLPSSKQLLDSFLDPIVTDSKEVITKSLEQEKYICFSLNYKQSDGNDMLAAAVHCVNHKFELVTHALGTKPVYKSECRDEAVQQILNEYLPDGAVNFHKEKIVTVVCDDGDIGRLGSSTVKCIWHLVEDVMTSLQDISGYATICEEVSEIIACLSESGIEGEVVKLGFQTGDCHRWDILLHAITFMLRHFDDLNKILPAGSHGFGRKVNLSDKEVYVELQELLTGIQRCIMTVRDHKRPTLNQAALCRAKLVHFCSTSSSSSIVVQVKEFLSKKFEETLELSPLHMVASFLDPRCKSLKVLSDIEKGEVHRYVLEMMKAVSVTEANSGVLNLKTRRSSPIMSPSPTGDKSFPDTQHPFSEFMDSPSGCDMSVSDSEEIMAYVNMKIQLDNDDILSWWRGSCTSGLPTLRRLARKLLAVPATCTYAYQMNNHALAVTQKMGIADQNLLNSVLHMKYNTM